MRTIYFDCFSGASGDMLLGALVDAGLDVAALARELEKLDLPGWRFETSRVTRSALAATKVDVVVGEKVEGPHGVVRDYTPGDRSHDHDHGHSHDHGHDHGHDHEHPHDHSDDRDASRSLAEILAIVERSTLSDLTKQRAATAFRRLGEAEALAHGTTVDDVHFHEVGAVDAIVDVVGVCLGFHTLGLRRLTVSPIAVGAGTATTQHGPVPLPGPAVLELFRDSTLVAHGETAPMERATPTGVALLAELANGCAPMPAMRVRRVGVGAGARDTADRPNVVRLVVGEEDEASTDEWVLLEANVDDLDPRLWPGVIDALLGAGAADAWLTPIVMKKGRPAHTVSALTVPARLDAVRRVLFVESSTIGARTTRVGKSALARETVEVDVHGQRVRVKVARLDGTPVSATPEWEDVSAAAATLGRPAKDVLGEAAAAAREVLG
jgi:uncharacterized protein (TIGR00299 family) protein